MKHIRLARLALALTPLSLAVAALPTPAPAQAPLAAPNSGLPPGTPPLTPAQIQRQQARLARARQDAAAIQGNASLSPAQKSQQLQALQASVDRDMLAILTPQQQQAVIKQRTLVIGLHNEFIKQHQSEINQQKQIGVQLQKSITPQQKQKIDAINKQAQAQVQKLLSDPKTSPQVKQQTGQAIARDATRQALAVLTPAQQAMLTKLQRLQVGLNQDLVAFAKAHGQQ